MINRNFDDRLEVLIAVLAPNIARVDSILREKFGRLWVRSEELVAVVVKVANDWRSEPLISESLHDLRDRRGRCVVIHGDAYDLTSSPCQVRDLRRGARRVGGISVRHRLHNDWVG